MTDDNAIKLLAALGSHNASLHGEWVRGSCPLAFHRHQSGKDANPSFGIHIEPTGRSGYQCFSCQIRSRDLQDLIVEISYALKAPAHSPPVMNLVLAQQIIEKEMEVGYQSTEWTPHAPIQQFEEFPGWWLNSFMAIGKFPLAIAYMNSRHVPPAVWSELEIRYDPTRQMVCFPFFNIGGRLAGMRGRSVSPVAKSHHYDYSFNSYNNTKLVLYGENRIDWMKPVVVVEGEFDYCRVFQVYPNVVANLTASLSSNKVETLALATSVIGFFDNDAAGKQASQQMQKRLGPVYQSVLYPLEFTGKDPGEMPLSMIKKVLAPFV